MILEILTLLGIGFVGTVVWVVNAEFTSAVYGSSLGWNPFAVGAVAGLGQVGAYALVYVGGEALVKRWAWLHGKVDATRRRFRRHLEEWYLSLTFLGGFLGVPPVIAMVALASGFGVPAAHALPAAFLGRFVRFTILAAIGDTALEWWTSP